VNRTTSDYFEVSFESCVDHCYLTQRKNSQAMLTVAWSPLHSKCSFSVSSGYERN